MKDFMAYKVQKQLEDRLTLLGAEVANLTDKSMQAALLLSDIYHGLASLQREIETIYIELDDDLASIKKTSTSSSPDYQ